MDSSVYEAHGPTDFHAAYDKVLAQWPADTRQGTVATDFGSTRVNSCGPGDGPPLVLLPGGRATSASWFANAAALSRVFRVHAVDLIGDAGRSVPNPSRPVRTVADLAAWLDAVLDGLGIGRAALAGHSYGGWIALHYALHAPGRVTRLALLDPTQCFAGYRAGYLLHALPMVLRPTARRIRAFLEWETGGVPPAAWLRLQETTAGFPTARPVTGPRPSAAALRSLRTRVLLLVAANSRTHDPLHVAARAAELLQDVETHVLPEVSHHALPYTNPTATNRRLLEFLGG
ncbi:alpha/beta fold hydrolase [Streptomyces chiangmaiensis]|uniref:Alpha/beta fold hydrolase n=1 Tax=Streptomyces chiangmaiensis TaxID=766497 RepID=A0ABU7FKS8_9ACTN|nr:alpha/beta fold hydrolase [Streptomyces chiangmaiensis]MED7824581.1 alpha/beta fold hydrolase [Streptomyces chiangmaiensis]